MRREAPATGSAGGRAGSTAPVRAVLWAALAAALPAHAQPLDDVVISAGRGEQRSFDAPAAIESINAQTIRESGPGVNLSESLNRVPGVVVLNRQNYAQDLQLSIRGFGTRSTFGIRGVRLLVDGIPATMPDGQGQASTISLPSTARIEVLRGPIAQLYGNAAGGVVQAFTADGPAVPMAEASVWAGSDNLRRYGLQAGGQAGALNWIVDGSYFSSGGYREHSEATRRHFNGKFRWDLGERTQVTLVANSFDMPWAQDPLGLTRAQLESNPRQAVPAAFQFDTGKSVRQDQVGVIARHGFDADRTLTARAYIGTRDLSNKLSTPLAAQAPATSSGGIVEFDRTFSGIGLQYAQRVRLGAESQLMATVGLEADRSRELRRGYLNSSGVRGALKRDEADTVTSTDVYAQLAWMIDANWTLTGGLRSSRIAFDVADKFVVAGNPDDSGAVRYSATNPVIGITRHLGETLNVYANVGRGFETPTFTELFYRNSGSGPNFALLASKSTHAEIGAKWRPGPDHRVDLALFRIDTRDEIVTDVNSGGRSTFRNGGRTARSGLELSWQGRLAPDWTAYAALTTLSARFRDDIAASGGTVAAGNRLPGSPERFAYAELAWRPRAQTPAGRFDAGLEMVHTGRIWVNDSNTDAAAASTVFALRAGLQQTLSGWRLRQFLRVSNLTDRAYAGSVIVNEANGRFFEPAPGRQWLVGVSAAYSFR